MFEYSKEDLYKRLLPALRSKQKMLRQIGINYVKPEDIWNYLSLHVWVYKENLGLNDLVDDILTLSNIKITNYVKEMIEDIDRPAIF